MLEETIALCKKLRADKLISAYKHTAAPFAYGSKNPMPGKPFGQGIILMN